ncbi:MAG: phosphatidylglycerophosphatase A [Kordiimonadales bacterium]|nr:MAG: phosphatidylglycerophosphatase A [Kordiimonadales bacterium]
MAKETLSNWDGRFKSIAYWWAVGFGSGLMRPAPGTWGSLLGLVFGYGILQLPFAFALLLGGAAFVTALSIWSINAIEAATGVHDAPEIVIDEIAGQWIAMAPLALLPYDWRALALSFVLFRIFDIIKPWPIGPLDKKVSGGFGVMIDDIVAGIIAALLLTTAMLYLL